MTAFQETYSYIFSQQAQPPLDTIPLNYVCLDDEAYKRNV